MINLGPVWQVDWDNMHHYGGLFASSFRLRKKMFVDRLGWDVPTAKGKEYDQFDTPNAVYLIAADRFNNAMGMTRLLPTTSDYMLKSLWADRADPDFLVNDAHVWESTRFGIDPDIDNDLFVPLMARLATACAEYAVVNDIHGMLAYTSDRSWELLEKIGLDIKIIGDPVIRDGQREMAGWVPFNMAILQRCYDRNRINPGLISNLAEHYVLAAE